jgi:hypothetical protein
MAQPTLQQLTVDVSQKRAAYQHALDAWNAYCFGTDRRGNGKALSDAYYQATTELNRAQFRLENHPEMTFDLWTEMFEPHPVPYPVSC